ncbi:MAG: ribosome assembly RNA-binding protein YhbY [Deltaproteobacteria bacterium]|nr:ribosome assembly RNA-binding protein YhbY [Deltaproteobacteria bacterium]
MNKKKKQPRTVISNKEARQLRALGHHLTPLAMLGREGLSDAVLASVDVLLSKRELIKVKVQNNCPLDRNGAAGELSLATGAAVAQVIGGMILLYRPNPDLVADKRIQFS